MRSYAQRVMTRSLVWLLSVTLAVTPAAFAQYEAPPGAQPYAQQELDRMLAPIALYPDSLLSQLLMAATYPLEIVEAARWSRARPNLRGDAAVRAAESMDWDPSVKSLVAFPQILSMMDEQLGWTKNLGEAFLVQQPQMMDTVQALRERAYAAGNLRSTDELRVMRQDRIIVVEPARPQVVYVPYYDPHVVYGSWWWPAAPVYWSPWPGYYARPGHVAGFAWGIGIGVTAGFFFGGLDWHHRRAKVVHVNNYYYRPAVVHRDRGARNVVASPGEWRHNPAHRRGVPYRDASLRENFARGDRDARRDTARPADRRDDARDSQRAGDSRDEAQRAGDAREQARRAGDAREQDRNRNGRPDREERASSRDGKDDNGRGDRNATVNGDRNRNGRIDANERQLQGAGRDADRRADGEERGAATRNAERSREAQADRREAARDAGRPPGAGERAAQRNSGGDAPAAAARERAAAVERAQRAESSRPDIGRPANEAARDRALIQGAPVLRSEPAQAGGSREPPRTAPARAPEVQAPRVFAPRVEAPVVQAPGVHEPSRPAAPQVFTPAPQRQAPQSRGDGPRNDAPRGDGQRGGSGGRGGNG